MFYFLFVWHFAPTTHNHNDFIDYNCTSEFSRASLYSNRSSIHFDKYDYTLHCLLCIFKSKKILRPFLKVQLKANEMYTICHFLKSSAQLLCENLKNSLMEEKWAHSKLGELIFKRIPSLELWTDKQWVFWAGLYSFKSHFNLLRT